MMMDFIVYNGGDIVKWNDGSIVIFSDYTYKSESELISEREDLQVGDSVVWVKDLPKKIYNQYKKQIKQEV